MTGDTADLETLARESSREARRALADRAADILRPPAATLTDRDRATGRDLLAKLVAAVEAAIEQKIVARAAAAPHDPWPTGPEPAERARPVLERAGLLRDLMLIEAVNQRAREHALAARFRPRLGDEPMIGRDTLEQLIRGEDAELSKAALDYLVAESRRLGSFQEPLLDPAELPEPVAVRLHWRTAAAMRAARLAAEPDLALAALDPLLESATRSALAELRGRATATASSRAGMVVRRLRALDRLDVAAALRHLQHGRPLLYAAALAELLGTPPALIHRVTFGETLDGAALALRAAGAPPDQAEAVLRLLDWPRRAGGGLERAARLFQTTEPHLALAALRFWDHDSELLAAAAEIERGEQAAPSPDPFA